MMEYTDDHNHPKSSNLLGAMKHVNEVRSRLTKLIVMKTKKGKEHE